MRDHHEAAPTAREPQPPRRRLTAGDLRQAELTRIGWRRPPGRDEHLSLVAALDQVGEKLVAAITSHR